LTFQDRGLDLRDDRNVRRVGELILAEDHLTRAPAIESDPARRADLFRLLAVTRYSRGRGDDAIEAVAGGLAVLAVLGHRFPRHPVTLAVTTLGRFLAGTVVGRR